MTFDGFQPRARSADDAFGGGRLWADLVGESSAFKDVVEVVRRLARCDAPVLIEGETGTGKEAAARAIHYLGGRREYPFVPVNCGAIPENLIEDEFFGHERGAFTDAKESRPGVIAQARGGTLFLDEVEALSKHAQVALLRFLQEGEYRPVGSATLFPADVRVIAATNVDLARLAARGEYRLDLLYRLNVLQLLVPPLRERDRDALLLADTFLGRLANRYGTPPKTLDSRSVEYVLSHAWPGNVRELQNLIHREFLLTDGPTIQLCRPARTPPPRSGCGALTAVSFRAAKARVVADFERAYIIELLARAQGNISLAARIAGKDRSRLAKLVKKHRLERAAFLHPESR